jgi:hypothetical protein
LGYWTKLLLESWIIASYVSLINIITAAVVHTASRTGFDFFTASNLAIPEFGVMLLLGACFLGRQPLEDEKRFDEAGLPTRPWLYALFGRKVLVSSLFLMTFGGLFYILGLYFPP